MTAETGASSTDTALLLAAPPAALRYYAAVVMNASHGGMGRRREFLGGRDILGTAASSASVWAPTEHDDRRRRAPWQAPEAAVGLRERQHGMVRCRATFGARRVRMVPPSAVTGVTARRTEWTS
jgi:hypothetical protein